MCPVFAFLYPSPSMLVILGVLAVLLFGERLPEVARSIGKQFMEFKKSVGGIHEEFRSVIDSATSTTSTSNSNTATPIISSPRIGKRRPHRSSSRRRRRERDCS